MIELNKTYRTKLATGDLFTVTKINKDRIMGIWVGLEHLGECPLYIDRLIDPDFKEKFDIELSIKNDTVTVEYDNKKFDIDKKHYHDLIELFDKFKIKTSVRNDN